MATESTLISVIIPTYNSSKYLAEAIESILRQNYQNIEIIVIDDGSTDNTVEVLAPYQDKIIYRYQENSGPAAARNYGIRLAKGDIIGFLDADDLWPKDKIERQLSHFQEFPDAEIVVGRRRVEYLSDAKELAFDNELISEEQACHSLPVMLVRRSAFEKVGYLDEDLMYHEDKDWRLRAREKGLNILVYDEVTNIHRRHADNMTHDIQRMKKYAFTMFRKSLKRRREDPNIKIELPAMSEMEKDSTYEK